jgi:hypothetical protein
VDDLDYNEREIIKIQAKIIALNKKRTYYKTKEDALFANANNEPNPVKKEKYISKSKNFSALIKQYDIEIKSQEDRLSKLNKSGGLPTPILSISAQSELTPRKKRCPSCGMEVNATERACPICNYDFSQAPAEGGDQVRRIVRKPIKKIVRRPGEIIGKEEQERERVEKERLDRERIESEILEKEKLAEKKHLANLEELKNLLSKALLIPQYLESNTTAEIVVQLHNTTSNEITRIRVDFSDLESDFEVEGTIKIDRLRPNAEVESFIKIKPRYLKGSFPIKIIIWGNGVSVEKEYTIKVGGTEIY